MNLIVDIPHHVAIIMDGNGRWAKQRRLPRAAGHHEGAKAVRRAVEFARKNNIKVLSLFALSVENRMTRPATEVTLLLKLFSDSLSQHTKELHENNVRIRIVGDRSEFNPLLLKQIEQAEQLTVDNSGMTLVVAINYSGRWDIVEATKRVAARVARGELNSDALTESHIQENLCWSGYPDPDLLIRTSGELRISNFMLWQLAYSELYFTDAYWPDFDEESFQAALSCYQSRERRFGKTSEQLEDQHA